MSYDPHSTARAGVVLPPSPQVRLVPRTQSATTRSWPVELPESGTWKVTGAAGTGVSSFLIDTVIHALDKARQTGADPSGILVIAPSKESGARLRRELSERLEDYAAQTSMVRSVHSLAFALLRTTTEEELRLITGAEQDAVIRELLTGQAEDGHGSWPAEMRPALEYVGFARQLRDFLLRSIERGLGPGDLERLGAEHGRPMWSAAGEFLREYERVQLLSRAHSYSAAELVTAVLQRPQLLREHPFHTIIVDDAQLLDPTAGKLIREMAPQANLVVVGGDADQSVFAFRGASSRFLRDFPADHDIELTEPHRTPSPACISIVDSDGRLRDVVANTVRRRHLEDGVPWRDIAVIVRSTGDIGQMRRTLLAAGVPVHISPTDVVLAEQRLVSAVLLALRALEEDLSNSELEELLTGPVGGADPVTLRRLIRGLRRWDSTTRGIDSLRGLLYGELPDFNGQLTEREYSILERVRAVLSAGRDALASGDSVEEVLWAVWSATELDNRLQASALRGGATGSQADRDLDAMMALFDAAGDYVERRPDSSLRAFLTHITEQELPTGVRDRRTAIPQAVEILTAHGAVGREWDTVIVAGAQEGSWPSRGETGSIFGQEDLIDLLDHDIDPDTPVSHVASRLAEERRLFHVATTRHRQRLLIAAVENPEGDTVSEPSRFISEFAGRGVDVPGQAARRQAKRALRRTQLPRELGLDVPEPAPVSLRDGLEVDPLDVAVLSVPAFVAQLRRVVTNQESGEVERKQAARQLARLAAADIPGAHPEQWWSARSVAAEMPLHTSGSLSPSRVEALLNCPLKAVLGNVAEDPSTEEHLLRGTLAHAFFEAIGRGMDAEKAKLLVMEAFERIQDVPQWQLRFRLDEFSTLLDRAREWARQSEVNQELAGVEIPVGVRVSEEVRIGGYMDRLLRDGEGNYLVVDLKTGRSKPAKKEGEDHVQLMTYQLALAHGAFDGHQVHDGEGMPRQGGVLVYPGATTKKIGEIWQSDKSPEALEEFAALLPPLVEEMRGPRITARTNKDCDKCPIRSICPVQEEGRMTTDA